MKKQICPDCGPVTPKQEAYAEHDERGLIRAHLNLICPHCNSPTLDEDYFLQLREAKEKV